MTKLGFTTRQVHSDRMLNTPEHGGVHSSTSNSVLFEFKDAQALASKSCPASKCGWLFQNEDGAVGRA